VSLAARPPTRHRARASHPRTECSSATCGERGSVGSRLRAARGCHRPAYRHTMSRMIPPIYMTHGCTVHLPVYSQPAARGGDSLQVPQSAAWGEDSLREGGMGGSPKKRWSRAASRASRPSTVLDGEAKRERERKRNLVRPKIAVRFP
jgi:hypothetical protein